VRLTDPRVKKAPRRKRLWTMEQMHAFAAAAGRVRDVDRDEPTELERWRAAYAEAMIRMLSDCGLRLGELLPLERSDPAPGWLHVARTAHESKVQPGTKTTHHKREDEQGRDTPLPPTLEDIVRAMPPRIDTRLLFTTPTG
jgi:integrase